MNPISPGQQTDSALIDGKLAAVPDVIDPGRSVTSGNTVEPARFLENLESGIILPEQVGRLVGELADPEL